MYKTRILLAKYLAKVECIDGKVESSTAKVETFLGNVE